MKMNIILSPTRTDNTVVYTKVGSSIIVNGQEANFSNMTEGSTLPVSAISSEWFDGGVNLEGGVLTLTLILPLPDNYSQEQAFPLPLLNVPDGPLNLPKPLPVQQAEVIS